MEDNIYSLSAFRRHLNIAWKWGLPLLFIVSGLIFITPVVIPIPSTSFTIGGPMSPYNIITGVFQFIIASALLLLNIVQKRNQQRYREQQREIERAMETLSNGENDADTEPDQQADE